MAAVAAVLLPDLDVLFMRRADYDGDPWSGHVSFPGGRVEASDASPLAGAMRETWEELGLSLEDAEVLGELDPVAPVSGLPSLTIHAFVFSLQRQPDFSLNREVASVHRWPLEALLADEGRGPMTYRWAGTDHVLPCVDFDGVRLWGLTLRIVDDLLDRLDGRGIGLDRLAPGRLPV